MKGFLILLSLLVVGLLTGLLYALDPPHNATNSITCSSCHILHNAPGGAITKVAGNPNLCQSCHVVGGMATNKPLPEADQALPGPGLPTGITATGTSHRWDSGASGHATADAANTSTGKVQSGGVLNGRYAKTYTVTITTAGNVGAAIFSWSDTLGGTATGLITGTNVALDQGINVTFTNGSSSPSFVLGDRWRVYVRTDINQPSLSALAARISEGKIMCSTCHNEHSQSATPFDSSAPLSGAGRHFQRVNNDTDQMCKDCHSVRNAGSLSGQTGNLSHPVGVTIPAGLYKAPTTLPLDKTTSKVQCLSCHKPHYTANNDGTLLRLSNVTSLCTDCHTLADTVTPAAHLNTTTGALWPGGQYGSIFPQVTDTTKRGFCTNCHQPHGWPDNVTPSQDFPKLTVDREENLCYTCHDSNGPASKNAQTLFVAPKTIRHPIANSEQSGGRAVECTDCHNPHKARSGAHTYSATATSTRNQVSAPIVGVSGVSVNYTGLANFVAPTAGNYTAVAESTYEYQICFKCHSGYAFGTNFPAGLSPIYNTGTATFTNASTTVTGTGTTWTAGMVGMWIIRSSEFTTYKITAVPSATSITISPAYAGTTGSAQAYKITGETDQAQEFNPNNKSGHPIVTGLNSYPNSGVPKALTAAGMSAPWSTNLGTQTMMCSDCHNTDAASPAAQGPHGSAVNFMLQGPNTYWPTNSAGAKYNLGNNTSGTTFLAGLFCLNCHPMRPTTTTWVNNVHTEHSGPQGNFTPDQNACVSCHIVIPHGGKVSRLIATRTAGLPARYAYSNNTTNVWITAFIKAASPTGYATGNCSNAGCGAHGAITGETW